MILRSNRDLPGQKILYGLIPPAMPKFQLKSLASVSITKELMTEANPEYRALPDKLL